MTTVFICLINTFLMVLKMYGNILSKVNREGHRIDKEKVDKEWSSTRDFVAVHLHQHLKQMKDTAMTDSFLVSLQFDKGRQKNEFKHI